jgi:prepilin-type N-terminal cleavage/methylation domain-containing protein
MKQKQLRRSLRTAFTLIELLVVISIIAVLISLTTAAVMQVLKKVNELKTRTDIDEMHQALVNYTMKTSLEQPPSRFVLCETQADYITGMSDPNPAIAQLYSDSYAYLTRLFPRLYNSILMTWGTVQPGPPSWVGVDWNGNGLHDPPAILEGDQCLVFFLGGFNTQGFSTNPANPAQLGGDRLGPYFEFKPVRLVDPGRAASPGYRVYIDAYGKSPYVYFSSYKARNGYIRYASLGSDCSLVPQGPYNDGAGNYYNPDSFQIISAGRDTVFGNLPGGIWTPTIAPQIPLPGRDDMANFHDRLLGIP